MSTVLGFSNMCGNLAAAGFATVIGGFAKAGQWTTVFTIASVALFITMTCWTFVNPHRQLVDGHRANRCNHGSFRLSMIVCRRNSLAVTAKAEEVAGKSFSGMDLSLSCGGVSKCYFGLRLPRRAVAAASIFFTAVIAS